MKKLKSNTLQRNGMKAKSYRNKHLHILLLPWAASGLYLIYLISPGIIYSNEFQLSPASDGYLLLSLLIFFVSYTAFMVCLFRDELRALLARMVHKH